MLRGLTFLVSELKAVLALSEWCTDIVLSTCWQERYTEIVISVISHTDLEMVQTRGRPRRRLNNPDPEVQPDPMQQILEMLMQ